jgi:hypothetical protein
MSRNHAAQLMSFALAALMTVGLLGGVDRLAHAEASIGAAQVAMVASSQA